MTQKYSRRVRMYKEEFIAVHVYLNVDDTGRRYYDTVIYRKIKTVDGFKHVRGANLKPGDIPVLRRLLQEVDEFLVAETAEISA